MENIASIAAQIRDVFDSYEAALLANNIDALNEFFWRDPATVRLSPGGGLYGYDEIVQFRQRRDVSDIARKLDRVEILVLGPGLGVANAEYTRYGSGRRGAQSQVWKLFPEGWRIVSAHVSLEPAAATA